jgi:hypothetical protein
MVLVGFACVFFQVMSTGVFASGSGIVAIDSTMSAANFGMSSANMLRPAAAPTSTGSDAGDSVYGAGGRSLSTGSIGGGSVGRLSSHKHPLLASPYDDKNNFSVCCSFIYGHLSRFYVLFLFVVGLSTCIAFNYFYFLLFIF